MDLPVENVEEAVETKGSDVVAGEVLDDAHLVQHNDLWHEGDGFKPDAEGPGESPGGPPRVEDASQDGGHGQEHLEVRELITKRIVGRAVWHLILHKIDDEGCGRDEEDLHARVVNADEVHEQIRVSHQEHDQVDLLGFA